MHDAVGGGERGALVAGLDQPLMTRAQLLPASLIFGWIWSTVSPFAAFAFGAACAFAAALLLRAWVIPEAES